MSWRPDRSHPRPALSLQSGQDDCVIPLKQNANEAQSEAAKQAAVREFARKYAEKIGARPSRLSTGLVESNVATECSIKLRKVGYKRDEIHVNLKPLSDRSMGPLHRPNAKLEALNRFNRVVVRGHPTVAESEFNSKNTGSGLTMQLLLPESHQLGDPDVKCSAADLSDALASAKKEKDLVTMRYADVDACAGVLSVDDTKLNTDKVKQLFSLQKRHHPAEVLNVASLKDSVSIVTSQKIKAVQMPNSPKQYHRKARFAAGMPVPCKEPRTMTTPAVVARHRESVHRLSIGARTSQLLVGAALGPTQLDDEAYALSPARSSPNTIQSVCGTGPEESGTYRSHCTVHAGSQLTENVRQIPEAGIHWVAEIVEEISKPPKYTPEAVLNALEEFELGLRRWFDGVEIILLASAHGSSVLTCLLHSLLTWPQMGDTQVEGTRVVALVEQSCHPHAAQLDFAWSNVSKDSSHISDWSSQNSIQQRQESRFHMIQRTFKTLKDALVKSPQTGISFSLPALLMALRFTVNRATFQMYPRWLQTEEGAAAVKELDQTVTGWLDPHGYFASLGAIKGPNTTMRNCVAPTRKARMHFNDVSPHIAAVLGSPQSDGARRVMYPKHKCGPVAVGSLRILTGYDSFNHAFRVRGAKADFKAGSDQLGGVWPGAFKIALSRDARLKMTDVCLTNQNRL